jgi:hypothetical protein
MKTDFELEIDQTLKMLHEKIDKTGKRIKLTKFENLLLVDYDNERINEKDLKVTLDVIENVKKQIIT